MQRLSSGKISLHNKKKYAIYLLAFLIPSIAMLIIAIIQKIYPFGDNAYLFIDMGHQTIPFLNAYYDTLKNSESLLYAFDLGLGSGYPMFYGLTVSSITNFFMLLFPKEYILEYVMYSSMIKIGLCGFSFAFYLVKHFKLPKYDMVVFSSAYALSSFIAIFSSVYAWFDVFVLAPVVILALERLVKTGKGIPYTLLLAICILTNFYVCIMLCIFLVLYFIVILCIYPKHNIMKITGKFILYSCLAGFLVAIVIIPTIFQFSGNSSGDSSINLSLYFLQDFKEIFARNFFNSSYDIMDYNINIYLGVVFFIAMPLYFLNKGIKKRKKIVMSLFFLFLVMSFTVSVLDLIWHGFDTPNGYQARFGYLYIWLVLVMFYDLYRNIRHVKTYHSLLSFAVALVIIFACIPEVFVDEAFITLVLVGIYSIILFVYIYFRESKAKALGDFKLANTSNKTYLVVKTVFCCIIIAELFANMLYLREDQYFSRSHYYSEFEQYDELVEVVNEKSGDNFYRTEFIAKNTVNINYMLDDINSASSFSSTIQPGIKQMYLSLGLEGLYTDVSYSYETSNPLSDMLLSIKYLAVPKKIEEADSDVSNLVAGGNVDSVTVSDYTYIQNEYNLLFEDENNFLYENTNYLPMAYSIPKDSAQDMDIDIVTLETNDPARVQNDICNALGVEGDLYEKLDYEQVSEKEYNIDVVEDGYYYSHVTFKGYYEYEHGINIDTYRGEEKLSSIAVVNSRTNFSLQSLGELKEGDRISFDENDEMLSLKNAFRSEGSITIEEEDESLNYTKDFYRLNEDVLDEVYELLSENEFKVNELGGNKISGEITTIEASDLVIAVPYEQGWNAYVNGEKVTVSTFLDGFLLIPLEEGYNEVLVEFIPIGMYLGISITLISVVALILIWRRERRIK